jgi:general secretion pathway protein A
LEEIRLILNLQPDKKLINTVFAGQKEFNTILKKNKPLRQEFDVINNIEPLREIETEQYVMHRLKIAGSEKEIFSPEAIREIYSFSEGNPRLINIICDSSLSAGYAKKKKIIKPEIIRECAANCILPERQKKRG